MKKDSNTIKINKLQHDDFIWTWKSNNKNSKVSIWLPYFSGVAKRPGSSNWVISYNGGELEVDLKKIDFILFYGASGTISLDFLDALSLNGIIFIIHRRNMIRPYFFFPANAGDQSDLLSLQIKYRLNEIQKTYIARTLIKERFSSMRVRATIYDSSFTELGKAKSVDKVRSIEANTTALYWKQWFSELKVHEKRRAEHPLNTALDASSKFMYGIILRWVLFHKLSPCHGYLHVTTDYPSLVYDLMEPYRYIFEDSVKTAFRSLDDIDEKKLISVSLNTLKESLNEIVYVPATRQYVRRKNLLHGIVLALRAYLLGQTKRFVIPIEGEKKGGRPPITGYSLPGEIYKRK